jgi:hypothetical protein
VQVGVSVSVRAYARFDASGMGGWNDGGGSGGTTAKDTYPCAIRRVVVVFVVHDDHRMTILRSIPFDLAIVVTYILKTPTHVS